jgi:hypothetical protein
LELAARLEELLRLPLDRTSNVEPWDARCDDLRAWINANAAELPLGLPTYLMFYFHDADIRAKEPEYRTHQEQQVRRFIRQLRGEEPPDIRRPWWRFW